MNRPKSKRTVAYHEAGHAALALHFGFRFREISIIPNVERATDGHVATVSRVARASSNPFNTLPGRTARRVREWAIMALAGPAAESLVSSRRTSIHSFGQMLSRGWGGDLEIARALASRVCTINANDAERRACLEWLWQSAQRIVSDAPVRWMVDGIALALIERGSLSYSEASEAVGAAFKVHASST